MPYSDKPDITQTFEHTEKTKMSAITIRDLPTSTSKWLVNSYARHSVFKVFKTRRMKMEMERIPWPYQDRGSYGTIDNYLYAKRSDHMTFLSHLHSCLEDVDVEPMDWFAVDGNERKQEDLIQETEALIQKIIESTAKVFRLGDIVEPVIKKGDQLEALRLFLNGFVLQLQNILTLPPSLVQECTYQDLFGDYTRVFGILTRTGLSPTCEIPYEVLSTDKQKTVQGIKTKPDLVLCVGQLGRVNMSKSFAVVEVKVQRDLKNLKEGTRKRCAPPTSPDMDVKRRKSAGHRESSGDSGQTSRETTDHGIEPIPSTSGDQVFVPVKKTSKVMLRSLPSSAKRPTDEEKTMWNAFLPQLLGEVVGTGYLHEDDGKHRVSIGIAVTGFNVTFVSFACESRYRLHDIPKTSGAALDIFLSESLCILKREDRRRISKMLWYLATSAVS